MITLYPSKMPKWMTQMYCIVLCTRLCPHARGCAEICIYCISTFIHVSSCFNVSPSTQVLLSCELIFTHPINSALWSLLHFNGFSAHLALCLRFNKSMRWQHVTAQIWWAKFHEPMRSWRTRVQNRQTRNFPQVSQCHLCNLAVPYWRTEHPNICSILKQFVPALCMA